MGILHTNPEEDLDEKSATIWNIFCQQLSNQQKPCMGAKHYEQGKFPWIWKKAMPSLLPGGGARVSRLGRAFFQIQGNFPCS